MTQKANRSRVAFKHKKTKTRTPNAVRKNMVAIGEIPIYRHNHKVNIEPIKVLAQKLPEKHPLKLLLNAERSTLEPEEYLAKLESWLFLLREMK
jgi:hypothetical protein